MMNSEKDKAEKLKIKQALKFLGCDNKDRDNGDVRPR
jgi:hypothetical protein